MLWIHQIVPTGTRVKVLRPDLTVRQAARYLKEQHIGGAPVLDQDGRLVGFCSERDLVYRAVARNLDLDEVKVADIMTREVVTASLNDSVADCEDRLRQTHCRHIPILDGERVVACLSLRDFLRSELRECRIEKQQLEDYIQGAS